jgi:ATP-dependent Clp protease ATP-binding subunit ClpB
LIVMTSNLGSDRMIADSGEVMHDATYAAVMEVVNRFFKPEFLNRLDDILIFRRLTRSDIDAIVEVQMGGLYKALKEKKMTLDLDTDVYHWLGEKGYDAFYGARPLKRTIQRFVINPLSSMILEGTLHDHVRIRGRIQGDHLVFDVLEKLSV